MAHRDIHKIIMYSNGLVVCRDGQGRQAPPLQGMFWDVIENLRKIFGPEEIAWCVIKEGTVTELPFNEWFKIGSSLDKKPLQSKPLTNEFDGLTIIPND